MSSLSVISHQLLIHIILSLTIHWPSAVAGQRGYWLNAGFVQFEAAWEGRVKTEARLTPSRVSSVDSHNPASSIAVGSTQHRQSDTIGPSDNLHYAQTSTSSTMVAILFPIDCCNHGAEIIRGTRTPVSPAIKPLRQTMKYVQVQKNWKWYSRSYN